MAQRSTGKRLGRFFRMTVRAAGAGAVVLTLLCVWLWVSTDLPSPDRLRARAALGATRVLDRNGRLLYSAPDPLGAQRRPVSLSQMSPSLIQATLAVEDAGFYTNPGVDLRGIVRALWQNLQHGRIVAGGSTITQQLARSFLIDPSLAQERSLERKAREIALALKLTMVLSKDEILELYLNQTYYGAMSYGVEAASQRFFGKPARDLDLAEAALIAGLPQAPSRYDPFSNPAAARARQRDVLAAMVRAGFITPAEAESAAGELLQFRSNCTMPGCLPRAPHFVFFVLDHLAAELGPDAVARGGLTITTTLDLGLQEAAELALRRQIAALTSSLDGSPDRRVRNGAVVVLDPRDGAILAMVGSPDFTNNAIQGEVNAALALRQPGSAIKPLTYAAALEQGWTPATTILDVPAAFTDAQGRIYAPQNYDRTFYGPLSLREALATSSNVAAVRTLDFVGIPALLDIASRLGIVSLGNEPGRFGLALTLGGGEVTLLELTGAYAAFANGGMRVTPYAVREISGASLSESPAPITHGAPSPALDPQIAYLISDILSDRYARMRAFGGALDIDRPAAVKTGTTTDWRDNWTIGYTPDRVVGVWIGNADGRSMEAVSGVTGAAPVWRQVMLAAHEGLPPRAFVRPPGIVEVTICAEGGLLPSPVCPATRLERFIDGTVPQRPDDTHVMVRVDPVRECRAPDGYPQARTMLRIYRLLPPEAEPWALNAGVPRPPRTVCSPSPDIAGERRDDADPAGGIPMGMETNVSSWQSSPLLITSPAHGAVFAMSQGVPLEHQRIAITAGATMEIAEVTVFVNGEPVAAAQRAFWQAQPGIHRVWAEGRDAGGRVVRSPVVEFEVRSVP
ncbi:PBP1A family penicillin-binding protein [Roseiflexus sp.]|uniref:PBP1A family penicillin-binding protein n=1 Tax=Roseiflexus sp. TaxID=2562120 RepID=UPI00398B0AD7